MRKINSDLIKRMVQGDLTPLLNYIKTDNELRLEVRRQGEAFVYYRKGKALEIRSLKVDAKYGDVPKTSLAKENPALYFKLIKKTIDNWLKENKKRAEFDTQQKIAQCNQSIDGKYIIIDMEYAFEQNEIEKKHRNKRAVFDLVGIETKSKRIIFFEVKKGLGATKGQSGIQDHIDDYSLYLYGENATIFKKNLTQDIRNIISDKIKLGLLADINLNSNFGTIDPELIFIFHPDNKSQIDDFSKELQNMKKLIIVDNNNYKLK